ncbi:MAG: EamA family transporter [Bacteroidetes bacterium]|nr:MAG: EamA family transporter [Bacteroidota bacterium]
MSPTTTSNRTLVLAAFAAVYLIWGSTYLAILISLESITPFLLIGLRFSIAGALLVGWRLWRGDRAGWQAVSRHSLAGILMLFGGTGAVVWVEQYISSGLAAIIVASLPFWFVLLDYRQWSFNFSNGLILIGVLVGFSGIVLLSDLNSASFSAGISTQLWAILVLLGGCILWAVGSLYLKYQAATVSTTMGAGLQMLAAGFAGLLVAGLRGDLAGSPLSMVSTASWTSLWYLILFGSLIGYLSYVWLLQQRPAVQVGTYAYVNPVVALLLGWLIVAEPFHWHQLTALGVILTGVLLINLPKYVKKAVSRRVVIMNDK